MKRRTRWILALAFLVLLCTSSSVVILLADNTLKERVAAVPHYASAYVKRWRPTVPVPTPPTVSALARAQLLSTRTTTVALPTLVPTAQPPNALPPTFTPIPLQPTAPAASATPSITPSPTASPTPSATAYPLTPIAANVSLEGVTHAHQTWNNCGPTTITMNLTYYGREVTQREAASVLKPVADDKNVSPEQMTAYAQSQGFAALVRVGGNLELLQRFLSNGFPVIVETWILPDDHGGMGHYRLLTGYHANDGVFVAQDSYFGRDEQITFRELDEEWRVFNRKYIIVYRAEQAEEVAAILGPAADDEQMLEQALAVSQLEAQQDPNDPFAWFNIGSTFTLLGEPQQAALAFDAARTIGLPLRMFWYQFEIFEAYLGAERIQDVIDLGYTTAYSASGHEEAYYYRALAHYRRGEPGMAIEYLNKSLDYNPNFAPAAAALEEITG